LKKRMKAEFNVSFDLELSSGSMEGKSEFNLTFEEVDVEVIDEDEDGNRFLEISSVGSGPFNVKMIVSTEALMNILNATGGWEKSLRKWIEK